MTTQSASYCTTKKLDCCPITPVILCVPAVLLADGSGFLEASLTAVSSSNTSCGGQCYYTYTFEYDDADLANPATPLLPTEISGVICTGCLTNWIEYKMAAIPTYSTHVVCTTLGETIILKVAFNTDGEDPEVTAWNLDGTPYESELLICCFCSE